MVFRFFSPRYDAYYVDHHPLFDVDGDNESDSADSMNGSAAGRKELQSEEFRLARGQAEKKQWNYSSWLKKPPGNPEVLGDNCCFTNKIQ